MRSATKNKTGRDKIYLAWLHTQACVVCMKEAPYYEARGIGGGFNPACVQLSRTEAAHVGSRGLSQKCPDHEAIPLCLEHHREDAESAHKLGRKFWEHHGLVKQDVIAALNRAFEESR